MKKIRKAVVLCLLLALTVSALTACGDSKKTNYEVLVNDTAGKPVAGVTIQFCSDTECTLGTTNENGIAVFEKEAGSYTVHVLKMPRMIRNIPHPPSPVRLSSSSSESVPRVTVM